MFKYHCIIIENFTISISSTTTVAAACRVGARAAATSETGTGYSDGSQLVNFKNVRVHV